MNAEDKVIKFYFKDLQPGVNGVDGDDGISPTISVESIENGHRLTVTDVDGSKSFDIPNGLNGKDGTDGNDGVSPIISIEPDANGHTITIKDIEGTETFRITNGVSALNCRNALTDYLLDQKYDNLMDLINDGNVQTPSVQLVGNRIVEKSLVESINSDTRSFLISKTPRYLSDPYHDLTNDDFLTFNYDHGINLYCRISGFVQSMSSLASTFSPKIIVCTKSSAQSTYMYTAYDFKCGSGGNGIAQFGDLVFPVEDGDLRHENITLSIAVVVVLQPFYQNVDFSIDFYFGQIDLNSELTQNDNVFGSYNNSMYAEKNYKKDDLIIRNDKLYKANWDIVRGNRMDSDYDILQTSVSKELKELRVMIAELQAKG